MSARSVYAGRAIRTRETQCREDDLLRGLAPDPHGDVDEREPTLRERARADEDAHDHDLILGGPHGADCPWGRCRRTNPIGATPNGR